MLISYCIFFFNDTATTEIYTLSLHDALPIFFQTFNLIPVLTAFENVELPLLLTKLNAQQRRDHVMTARSEEHTSELQSLRHLVCRLLLEKKKQIKTNNNKVLNTDNEHNIQNT